MRLPLQLAAILCVVMSWTTSRAQADDATPKARPFEKEIVAYEAADAKTPPPSEGVLFVGSSSIRLWKDLDKDFPGLPVFNRGFGGSRIADSVYYADRIILPYKPKTIVFYAGDNDIAGGVSPQQTFADFKALVEKVHAKLPDTRILYISIKPSIARWKLVDQIRETNGLIKDFATGNDKLGYIDIFTPMLGADGMPRAELLLKDKLHMTRAGYDIWRDAIAPFLKK